MKRNTATIVIVGLMAILACAGVNSANARSTVTKTQIASFVTALDAFDIDCGRYPTSAEGLVALVVCPTNIPATNWHGPYLKATSIPKDPWGNDYIYRSPGIHNTNGCDLYSLGPDGISKTGGKDEDDDPNWEAPEASRLLWQRMSPAKMALAGGTLIALVIASILGWREIRSRRHRT